MRNLNIFFKSFLHVCEQNINAKCPRTSNKVFVVKYVGVCVLSGALTGESSALSPEGLLVDWAGERRGKER
jgi:hypothetical protein